MSEHERERLKRGGTWPGCDHEEEIGERRADEKDGNGRRIIYLPATLACRTIGIEYDASGRPLLGIPSRENSGLPTLATCLSCRGSAGTTKLPELYCLSAGDLGPPNYIIALAIL